MKKNLKRAMALSLAVMATAAMPMSNVFAAASAEGAIATSFTLDSPTLMVTVPTAVQLHVNTTFSLSTTAVAGFTKPGDYKKLPLYSDSIKISNATMNKDGTAGIPVVASLYATLKPKADGSVKIAYDEADVNVNGGEKSVFVKVIGEPYLDTTAGAAAAGGAAATGDILDVKGNGTGATYPTAGAAATPAADGGGGAVVSTSYGSMMQIAIPGPGVGAAGSGQTKPAYGGFVLGGLANVATDWEDGDLGVDLYYKVKATNVAYDASVATEVAQTANRMEAATDQVAAGSLTTQYKMLSAIKAAENITAAGLPSNDATQAAGGNITIANTQTNDAYLVIGNVDPTVTVTKVGFNITNEVGVNFDYILGDAEYKSGNLYCSEDAGVAGATDRILYINYLKSATSRPFMADLAKTISGTPTTGTITAKFFVVLSDGNVVFQNVDFLAKA